MAGETLRGWVTNAALWSVETLASPIVGRALESRFGGIAADGTEVVETSELSEKLLRDLFENRISGIRLSGFCAPEEIRPAVERMLSEELTAHKVFDRKTGKPVETDVFTVGKPYNHVRLGIEDAEAYFANVVPEMRRLRAYFPHRVSPTDRLRVELDELWPHGAMLALVDGRKSSAGLPRIMEAARTLAAPAGMEGGCHVDSAPLLSNREGRFSANIYLKVPERGGELKVWNINIQTWWDLLRNRTVLDRLGREDEESHEVLRSKLPPPIVIRPEEGDLILINTARPHAVRGFEEGHRVSLQTFIRYRAGRPLLLAS